MITCNNASAHVNTAPVTVRSRRWNLRFVGMGAGCPNKKTGKSPHTVISRFCMCVLTHAQLARALSGILNTMRYHEFHVIRKLVRERSYDLFFNERTPDYILELVWFLLELHCRSLLFFLITRKRDYFKPYP